MARPVPDLISARLALAAQRLETSVEVREQLQDALIAFRDLCRQHGISDAARQSLLDAFQRPGRGSGTGEPESILARLNELPQLRTGPPAAPTALQTGALEPVDPLLRTAASSQGQPPYEPPWSNPRATGPIRLSDERTSRYQDLGLLGIGGMAEVRRMLDRDLNRPVAMKIIRDDLMQDPASVARFLEEAQATSQLEHPGIIPLYELGIRRDGRLYFTMREVRGRTLKSVIREVHDAARGGRWESAPSGWSFRRLIDAFHKVCEALAYAHSRGVLHRDLKPSNILVGAFGEVLVVDWGLARVRGRTARSDAVPAHGPVTPAGPAGPAAPDDAAKLEPVVSRRDRDAHLLTRAGAVSGTPAYMPPEQARGEIDQLGPASDVYSLGAILYEILSGRPPYEGQSPQVVMAQVLSGPPPPPGPRSGVVSGSDTLIGGLELPHPGAAATIGAAGLELPHPGAAATIGNAGLELPHPDAAASIGNAGFELPHPVAAASIGDTGLEPPPIPDDLKAMCLKAMAYAPADRYADASALALEVDAWLEDTRRREKALELVARADQLLPEVDQARERAATLRQRAGSILKTLRPGAPLNDKRPAWSLEDEALELERQVQVGEVAHGQLLLAALTHVRDLPEAFDRLAGTSQAQHAAAEAAGDSQAAARAEALLRTYDRGRFSRYLSGDGALTLVTEPPGAEVTLYRYVEQDRRQVPQRQRVLGRTPLYEVPLPMGSYLLELELEGRATVRYPVHIRRQTHWDGVAPGASTPYPIYLPGTEELGPDDVYVPAGWCQIGGDPEAYNSLPQRRVWIDAFVMRRFPVTNRQYIAFLSDLAACGREAEALRWVPRERPATRDEAGSIIYGRGADGSWHLRADADGDIWQPDWPVLMVDWSSAAAYAAWERQRTGQPWRLPGELEWEKAARGVDGRYFPWGSFADANWACTEDTFDGRSSPASIHAFPTDESPYGIRGLAGNVHDWCIDLYELEGPPLDDGRATITLVGSTDPGACRVVRGGTYVTSLRAARSSQRIKFPPSFRSGADSFRLTRSIG